jgi:predicted naringenin-chalcone synthase
LSKELLAQSCANMRRCGSMSSATVMFVLAGMMRPGTPPVAAAPWRSAPVFRLGPCSSKQRAGGS